MAQTLLSGNISDLYDKLIFTKGDGKLYYTDTSGNTDVEFTQVTLDTELAAWAGTTNVTTLGTIGTGTWNATTIAVNKGGTGQTTYTDGQILVGRGDTGSLVKSTIAGTANEIEVTNTTGAIQLGIPTNPTLTGNTTINGKIVLQNGAIIDNSSAGNKLMFDVEDIYAFKTTDAVGDLIIELIADGASSADDINRIRSADGGTLYFENYEGSSWSTSLAVDKAGRLIVGGNHIRNSDNENVLVLTADQKLALAGNIIQNSDLEDVITIDSSQDTTLAGKLIINGDEIEMPNGLGNTVYIKGNPNSNGIEFTAENILFGSTTSTATLAMYCASGADSITKYYEGASGKWSVGLDGSTDDFIWAIGSGGIGAGTDKMKLSQSGVLTVMGGASTDGSLNLIADNATSNSKNWLITAENNNDLTIASKISGSHVAAIQIIPNATVANSTIDIKGTMQSPAVKTDAISEKTADNGIVVEGLTLKDNNISGSGYTYTTAGTFPKTIKSAHNGSRMRLINDDYTYIGSWFNVSGDLTAAKLTAAGMSQYDFYTYHVCKIKSIKVGVVFDSAIVYRCRIYKGTVTNGDTQMDSLTQIGSDMTFNSSSVVAADTFYEQTITVNESLSIGDRIYSAWMCDTDPGVPVVLPNVEYFLVSP